MIEIVDPGQKAAPPATSLEAMGLVGGDGALDAAEAGADARSLGGDYRATPRQRQAWTHNPWTCCNPVSFTGQEKCVLLSPGCPTV